MAETSNLRPRIVHVLRLLSSSEMQLEYERRVPGISIPSELLCQWFDDSYLPDSPVFRQCFSSHELEALAHFNNYFADHEKLLSDPHRGISNWLEDNIWKGIMSEARQTLAALES
ncbi:MAG TPA: hypothetical protein VH350_14210 [Candidatus Sulfotelmatobacter sp.]|jgi:hypothetical protein|nr:hypothetical protein [Candidatus Sulfotelmatobacter sp.]